MRRRLLLQLSLIALVGALATTSCLSPTLPLPPPEVETVTQSVEAGVWLVSGTCKPGARVTVLNDDTGMGAVYEDRSESGTWFVEIEAEQCDPAWVEQAHGTQGSGRTDFTIDTDPPSGACNN
jgi:hypothetical protein